MPVAVTLFFITPNVSFHRNWLPAYPFLAVQIGVAAVLVARKVERWPNGSIVWRLGVASLVIGDAVVNDLWYITHMAQPEPRSAVVDQLAKWPDLRVALPDELRIHTRDRRKLLHPVTGPLRDLACSDTVDRIVLPPSFGSWTPNPAVEVLNAFLGIHRGREEYSERFDFTLGPTSEIPTLRAAETPIRNCEGFVPFAQMENVTNYPVFDGILALIWNGPIALAIPTPAPGRYEVIWELRGRTFDSEPPRVLLATTEDTVEVPLADEWQLVKREFSVTAGTNMRAIRLEFINDGSTPETDRNVELNRVWVRRI